MSVTILARDINFNIIGEITGWTRIEASIKFNEVGVWTLTFPAFPLPAWLTQPGAGIVIIRNGTQFCSGPVDTIPYTRNGESDTAPGTLAISGATDLVYPAERLIFPDPTQPASNQSATGSYSASGPAGQLINSLVTLNASASCPVANRQIPNLVVDPAGAALGTVVSLQERFTPLLDTVRTLALAGGGLGFTCGQQTAPDGVTQQLLFSQYVPRDLSLVARFSFDLGNLQSVAFSQSSPTVTRAIVGGSGTGSARTITQYISTTAESQWGRVVESFVDQASTSDTTLLAQAGADALTAGANQVQLSSTTVDSPTLKFGTDNPTLGVTGYGLGDLVSISPYSGFGVVDLVRQVTLTCDASGGELIAATVGDGSTSTDPAYIQQIKNLDRRMSKMERV